MLIVFPRGIVKDEILLDTPNPSCIHFKEDGRHALLDAVENATIIVGENFLKNFIGLYFPINTSIP